jgi:hypothetical protein
MKGVLAFVATLLIILKKQELTKYFKKTLEILTFDISKIILFDAFQKKYFKNYYSSMFQKKKYNYTL